MRFSEFASKDVVSVDSGERLGQVNDIDFDEHYHIQLLYVSERASGLRRDIPPRRTTASRRRFSVCSEWKGNSAWN